MTLARAIERTRVVDARGALEGNDLRRAAGTLAVSLAAAGLRAGGVIALALDQARALLPALAAAWDTGATVVLVPPALGQAELRAVIAGLSPTLIVTAEGDAARIAGATGSTARSLTVQGLPPLALIARPAGRQAADLAGAALVKLSSGSTGTPKAVVLTHANVEAEAANVAAALGLGPGDRVVAPVPLTHSYGFDLARARRARERRHRRAAPGALAAPRAGRHGGCDRLSRRAGDLPRRRRGARRAPPELGGARYLLSCTAPLSPDLIRTFASRFGAPICQHYGSSETGAVANHQPDQVLVRPESVGRAIGGVSVRVADDTGELVVEGPAVAIGYALGGPAGATPLAAGAFRTGDLAEIDADGFIRIHGRRDSVINVGGLKVSPQEVSEALERHPAVRQAAVVGVPDARGEQLVTAAVVLARAVPDAELIAHCAGELAEHKIPRRIVVCDALPVGPSGKVRLRADDLVRIQTNQP